MDTLRLTVERATYGVDCIAHTEEGKTVFVAGAVPGDVVEARLTADGRSFSKAVVERVLEPSPNRVESPCPLVDVCGGCPWGHVAYGAQLEAKRANVMDALTRIGHLDARRTERLVAPCIAPGEPWGYRNKVELAFARRNDRALIGMHGRTGTDVVRVDACPLLQKGSTKLTKAVAGAASYLANAHRLSFERIGIRSSVRTREIEVALWTEPGPFPRAQVAKVMREGARATSVVRVLTKGPAKARRIVGVERLGGKDPGASMWETSTCA